MRVLFASAELAPWVKVGGLGDFSAGLVRSLRRNGVEVEFLLPDYGNLPLEGSDEIPVDLPEWAGPASIRKGALDDFEVSLVSAPSLIRPHPYTDSAGVGWSDNDRRFFTFSVAVAAVTSASKPDVLHLNDWHTGPTLGFLDNPPPSLLTIHNLAYQGTAGIEWLQVFSRRSEAYEWYGNTNPLTGAIALSDRVVTVSPTFAAEALAETTSFGLDGPLSARGDDFFGILNGIDTDVWDPANDPHLPVNYDTTSVGRKRELRGQLLDEFGWEPTNEPLVGMVSRLTDQKGVDIALGVVPELERLGARMVLLGSGDRTLAAAARDAWTQSDRFVFREGYDEALAHRIFGGCDLYLMPSRFEPAGLTQMQAMRYGTIPVVTDVGGLHDTVIDCDADPENGTGFVASDVTVEAMIDALDRAVRAWRTTRRRGVIRRRGMERDWSWDVPGRRYAELYQSLRSAR